MADPIRAALERFERSHGPLEPDDLAVVLAERYSTEADDHRRDALHRILDELDAEHGSVARDDIEAAVLLRRSEGTAASLAPDGWTTWPDGQPYPDGVATDSSGWPMEAAGFYALRQALEDAGAVDPNAEAWNALMAVRELGFDVVWERRSAMQLEIDRLRSIVRELVPCATEHCEELASIDSLHVGGWTALWERVQAGEFNL